MLSLIHKIVMFSKLTKGRWIFHAALHEHSVHCLPFFILLQAIPGKSLHIFVNKPYRLINIKIIIKTNLHETVATRMG